MPHGPFTRHVYDEDIREDHVNELQEALEDTLTVAETANLVATHAALTEVHGVTGEVVGTTDAQTLINKEILTPTGITKLDIGLDQVDNTADADKPISAAVQDALNDIAGAPTTSLLTPFWVQQANITTVTAIPTGITGFLYIGKATTALTTFELLCRVATAAATITWAEVGIFTGDFPETRAGTSLSRRGYVDVSAIFNSTGLKAVTITASGITAGDDLWLAYGSSATTPFQLRGGLADEIQTGAFQSASGRPSTFAVPTTPGIVDTASIPAWLAVRI
jgi:hypothetical protein